MLTTMLFIKSFLGGDPGIGIVISFFFFRGRCMKGSISRPDPPGRWCRLHLTLTPRCRPTRLIQDTLKEFAHTQKQAFPPLLWQESRSQTESVSTEPR